MARYSRTVTTQITTATVTWTQTSPAGRPLKYCAYPIAPWARVSPAMV